MAGTVVCNTLNTDTGLFSTNNAYSGIAKAWVNFNGTSGTINGSFNVSSITTNATGDYTVNFATALTNANYSVAGTNSPQYGTTFTLPVQLFADRATDSQQNPTTTSFRCFIVTNGGVSFNPVYVCLSVFGA